MSNWYGTKARWRSWLFQKGVRRYQRKDRCTRLLDHFQIDVVFDIGANAGQFARKLLDMSYRGRIVSFEPLATAYDKLKANAHFHPTWETVNTALGAFDGEATLHVSGNSQSSSLLDMLPRHVNAAPSSKYIGEETVRIRRLDTVIDQYTHPDDRIFLKVDAQGAERDVLAGARQSLHRCAGIQLEMSTAPLYDGEATFLQLTQELEELGYCPMSFSPGFFDNQTQRMLQVDGVFYRRELVEPESSIARAA